MKLSNFWRFWLPMAALSLFSARCLYEWQPLAFAFLGDRLFVFPLTLAAILLARWLLSRTLRGPLRADRLPPDLSPLLLLFVYVVWPPVDLLLALTLSIGSLLLLAQGRVLRDKPRWFDLAVGLMVCAIYLVTLGDHVGNADTFEFQVVAPQLGIAHPTGYPLFVIVGKLFTLLPFGSPAWRVNLTSAVFATLAVWLIYRTIVLLISDRLASALAALALAASPVFWSQAVVAEVYALNAMLVAGIVFFLLTLITDDTPSRRRQSEARRTEESLPRADDAPDSSRDSSLPAVAQNDLSKQPASDGKRVSLRTVICLLSFALGLALSHHLTSVILIPPIAIALLLVRPKLSLRSWLLASGCLLLGLTPWLYIYLRWPGLHDGQWMTIGEWLGWISAQRFGGALNLSLWSDPTRWGIVTRLVIEQFGPIGLALAIGGLAVFIKRSWRSALITFVGFAGYGFYGLVYNVPDIDVFIIPAFLFMAMWIGIAVGFLASKLQEAAGKRPEIGMTFHTLVRSLPVGRFTLYLLFALLPLGSFAGNFNVVNQHGLNADKEAWGRYVLSLPIPARAALLVDSEKIAPLYYLQVTEKLRPDLDILVLGDEPLYRQELDRRINAGQPVYLARFLPNLPYRMRSLGPLVEVSREPLLIVPRMAQTFNASFGDQIELLGATSEQGDPYRITLDWRATSPERENYHVRLRLIDGQGNVWWEDTGAHPVGGYYPTGAWVQHEIVPDFHEFDLEPYLPPGTYALEVGLFTPFRADGLAVNGSRWLKVASVQITAPRTPPLAHAVRLAYDQTVIASVDELGAAPPASQMTLRLDATGAPLNAVIGVLNGHLVDSSLTQTIQPGQTRLVFAAPGAPGDYEVRLTTGKAARCHWLADLSPDCTLAALKVEGDAIGHAINFENQVLLTDAKIDRDAVKPGESLKIDLTWRGLKTWPDDYTAFVHLLGPDGKVHGQVDQWPVQGTLPTSSWTAGQVVDDPYEVTLPADAPSGKYQVEVGWYLLATLRRLNVLGSAGRPSDDHVIVGEFTVP